MRYIQHIIAVFVTLFVATSCIKEPSVDYNELEQRSLRAWINLYHPELIDNYQEEGGYYVEVLNEGNMDSLAVTGKDVWVWYDFTSRALSGNILETRSADIATQLNTFNKHTHYVPAFRFSGKDSHTLMEGTYLATFNKLKIGDGEMEVRHGTQLRLYLPSSILKSDATTNDGGYEGEFAIDNTKPMIVDMTVYGHVGNPVAYEGDRVDSFAEVNGGLCTEHSKDVESEKSALQRRSTTRGEEGNEESNEEVDRRPLEFFDGRWHQPVDTMKHLLVNYTYAPTAERGFDFKGALGADTLKYPNESQYSAKGIYANNSMNDIDRRINEALIKRFGRGIEGEEQILDADSVTTKASVKIWYIGRFLDGFIFDTNIDEVNEILYGTVEDEGTALTFETKDPVEDNDYIVAWEYALPTLRLGQWAAVLTVSTYGYGIAGKVGSHTSTTITDGTYDYANYYNYMNYMNNYYGGYYGGYGNMYNQGYYGYNPYYYGYTPQVTTTTVTTTSTEIPAFAPLLFQVFVEK